MGFGASLLVVGQIVTAVMAVGLEIGIGYRLVQMLLATMMACFEFGLSNLGRRLPRQAMRLAEPPWMARLAK